MIQLAHDDPFEKVTLREALRLQRCKRAYELFKLGWDTVKIAKLMHVTEALAEKYVTTGRCRARGLPIPYGVE